MKPKKLTPLKKQTVANLEIQDLQKLKGGVQPLLTLDASDCYSITACGIVSCTEHLPYC